MAFPCIETRQTHKFIYYLEDKFLIDIYIFININPNILTTNFHFLRWFDGNINNNTRCLIAFKITFLYLQYEFKNEVSEAESDPDGVYWTQNEVAAEENPGKFWGGGQSDQPHSCLKFIDNECTAALLKLLKITYFLPQNTLQKIFFRLATTGPIFHISKWIFFQLIAMQR